MCTDSNQHTHRYEAWSERREKGEENEEEGREEEEVGNLHCIQHTHKHTERERMRREGDTQIGGR